MLTEKETKQFIERYIERYGTTKYYEIVLPIEKEKEEIEERKKEISKILGRKAKSLYIHKGGRRDTLGGKAFEVLRLNYGPIFK